ncbi:MAG: AI-2E family transporter [Candidatus Atribacteria bacterium]|nr:AI-2E family transporter [Candidatus Atribacteria bacterium]
MNSFLDKQSKFLIQLVIGLIIFCFMFRRLNWILVYFSLALFLAYFFNPFYNFLLERGVKKTLSILLIFSIILAFAIFLMFFIIPNTINELNLLYKEIPGLLSRFQDMLLSHEHIFDKILYSGNLKTFFNDLFLEIQRGLLIFSRTAISTLSAFVTRFGLGIIIVPLVLYYLLIDMDLFKNSLLIFVSPSNRKDLKEIVLKIDGILSSFIRGRLIVCLIVGALITIGLFLLKSKFFFLIGMVSGILNFVPYFGPVVGWVLSLFFVIGRPWSVYIWVTILFVGVNQIEAIWLNPKILGKEMGLHPLTIIFAVLIFGDLLGFLGILFAVPIAATLKVIIHRYLAQEEKAT